MNKEKTTSVAPKRILDFASTSWFAPELTKLTEHLGQHMAPLLRLYPEDGYSTLRTMLAKRNNLHMDNLAITAGRTDAFYTIARSFAGSRVAILEPSYQHYTRAAQQYGWRVTSMPDSLETREIVLEDQDFCWLCSPSMPMGRYRSRVELLDLVKRYPKVRFVIDQSYVAFTTQPTLSLSDIKSCPNVIFVNSFTHTYGLPGLRVGYISADKKMIKELRTSLHPWVVSTMAVEVAKYILLHPAQFTLPIRKWQRNAQDLRDKLRQIDGLEVLASDAPFFLVQMRDLTSEYIVHALEERGILVYDAKQYYGLSQEMIRITSRTEEDNRILLASIMELCVGKE